MGRLQHPLMLMFPVERNVEKKIKSISVFIQIPHYTLYLLHYNALKNIISEVKILQP